MGADPVPETLCSPTFSEHKMMAKVKKKKKKN
jgi:hypothetical protein